MKLLLAVISIFALVPNAQSQVEALAEMLESGAYSKCIKKANKIIDKEPFNLDVTLLKAHCQCLGGLNNPDDDDLRNGVEASIITIKILKKKDRTGSFVSEHSEEIQSIVDAAALKLESYRMQDNCRFVERLAKSLVEVLGDPVGWYYQGYCLREDDVYAADASLKRAVELTYQRWKQGTKPSASLVQAFADYAEVAAENRALDIAEEVLRHGEEVFPHNDTLTQAYVAIVKDVLSPISYVSLATTRKVINLAMLGLEYHPASTKLRKAKWDAAAAYLGQVFEDQVEQNLTSFIDTLIADPSDDLPLAEAKLISLLTEVSLAPPKNEAFHAAHRHELYQALEHVFDLQSVSSLEGIQQVEETAGLVPALVWACHLKSEVNPQPAMERLLSELISADEGSNLSENMSAVWQLGKLFPQHEALANVFTDRGLVLAQESLDAQDFSSAGTIIQEMYELHPNSPQVNWLYKEWVLKDYESNYIGSTVLPDQMGWTGDSRTCDPGTISKDAMNKTLQRLNYFRRLAGLPDSCVTYDEYNKAAQAAALCMYANGGLSHAPPKSWKCNSDLAFQGASLSNLSLGTWGPASISGQMQDYGANNKIVGHRRYILSPYKRAFGIGSTTSSMALYVLGNREGSSWPESITIPYRNKAVSWPPAGYVPAPLVWGRWHFSMLGWNFQDSEVVMTRNGEPLQLEINPFDGYGAIIWEPELTYSQLEEVAEYTITITNAKRYRLPEPRTFTYTVKVIDVEP